jgi:hypothetical protein
VNAGKELDKHYMLLRYPNSYPQGAPYEYYTRDEAERAIAHTTHILAFCERLLAEFGNTRAVTRELISGTLCQRPAGYSHKMRRDTCNAAHIVS